MYNTNKIKYFFSQIEYTYLSFPRKLLSQMIEKEKKGKNKASPTCCASEIPIMPTLGPPT